MSYNFITAAEAASLIKDGEIVGLSGFTPAGSPKAVTAELAKLARERHERGEHFQIGIITGASTGDSCDGELTRAHAIKFRAPYTTNADFRKAVNNGEINYTDIHLSQVAQRLRSGFLGHVNTAIIEACELTEDGRIFLTAGVGISPTVARLADKIIVELNAAHSKSLIGMHDLYEMERPPYRRPIPIVRPSDRIGLPYIQVDPSKIVGVVEVNMQDEARGFHEADPVTDKIGQNVAEFLAADMRRGIIPSTFLPLQSGVGNIANAVLSALGKDPSIPPFEMYTEVIQNSVIKLVKEGRIKFGSTCSLSVTNDCLQDIYDNMDFFRHKLVLRPSEISNCPEVVRRIGVISMNTAIEADIYGNVNSTYLWYQDDERYRWFGRLHAQCVYLYFLLSFYGEGWMHQFHCTDGFSPGSQRAFGECHHYGTGYCRPAWQESDGTGTGCHRELCAPGLQAAALGLPEDFYQGTDFSQPVGCAGHASGIHEGGRYASDQLG